MALKLSHANDIAIYHCTAGRSKPQWEAAVANKEVKGSLRYNEQYRRRLELIQDFEFIGSSDVIHVSPDAEYIGVSGMYGPRLKMYQVSELGLKFERASDAQVVQFQFLETSFRKLALLRCDRTLEFHAQYGKHHVVRIPKFGRDLLYDPWKCDAIVAAAGNEIYRFNLEQGRFLAPYVSTPYQKNANVDSLGANTLCQSSVHGLLSIGREDGVVECWDTRDRTSAALLHIASTVETPSDYAGSEVTALQYSDDGLTLGVGLSNGHVLLYDLRSSRPYQSKDHRYQLPIVKIQFPANTNSDAREKLCVSTDSKSIRFWHCNSGDPWTTIESPEAAIHSSTLFPGSGLVMATGEQQRIQVWYIPSLGPAPQWCAFLDSLTEELQEKEETSFYEDYEFVTRQQLSDWNAEHLIGTNLLKAYMHGFFVHAKLCHRLKQAYIESLGPDSEAALQAVKPTVKQLKAADRILQRKHGAVRVNQQFADALTHAAARKRPRADDADDENGSVSNPLGDERFAAMFERPEFSIDPNSNEYQRIHPRGKKSMRVTAVGEKDSSDEDDENDEVDQASDNEDEDHRFNRVDDDDDDDDDEDANDDDEAINGDDSIAGVQASVSSRQRKKVMRGLGVLLPRKPSMFQLKDGFGLSAVISDSKESKVAAEQARSMTIEERLTALQQRSTPQPADAPFSARGLRGRGGRSAVSPDSIEAGDGPAFRRTMRGLLPRDRVDADGDGIPARGGRGGRGRGGGRGSGGAGRSRGRGRGRSRGR